MSKRGYTYIVTNAYNNVLYTGVTSELKVRIEKHRTKRYPGSVTARYNVYKLVFFEEYDNMTAAIRREKQIKAGSRAKKLKLITEMNPDFIDLYDGL